MKITVANQRPFTIFATKMAFGQAGINALNEGNCPDCKGPCNEFRDEISQKEYEISGLCQECQDKVFA